MLDELGHGREVRQSLRVVDKVSQRNQGMGLAAAVRQLELPDGLVVLACQPQDDIPHETPQVVRGKGEREELLRLLVHRPLAALHHDLVEVGGKHVERQLPGPQILAELHRHVPGCPG